MEVTFTCPHCNEVTLIGDEFVGQSGECRSCGRPVTIPKLTSASITSESAPRERASASGLSAVKWIFVICVVCFVLSPFVPFLLEGDGRGHARRMSSANNLKQIALAMHNYHSTYKQLPRAYWLSPDGKRTLSWRIALLPLLEQIETFESIDVSNVWDHEANKAIYGKVIEPYRFRGGDESRGTDTCYMVITGPRTLFEEGKDITFDDCSDGLSNTIFAVEVINSGVHWAEPKDLDIRTMIFKINAGGPNGIGAPWKSGANVAFADGSVRLLSKGLLESTLRAMITRDGGEAIETSE